MFNIIRKISVCLLAISFLASFAFLNGFVLTDSKAGSDLMKYGVESSGEDDGENGTEDGQDGEETNGDGEDENEQDEVEQWVCGECGYVYNPEEGDPEAGIEPGTEFENLPEDWVCPVCGASKDEFEVEEEDGEEDGWLAHLRHVLRMRSKHIEVLKRVIESMISKNPMHPSLKGLEHALESSSKTVLRAEEMIDNYIGDIIESEDEEDGDDQDGDDEDGDNEEGINENGANDDEDDNGSDDEVRGNGNSNESNGKGQDKDKSKEKENRGRGRNK
jgi:rubredoxin